MFDTYKYIEKKLLCVVEGLQDKLTGDKDMDILIKKEIKGVETTLKIIRREMSKELLELDKWATTYMLRRDVK